MTTPTTIQISREMAERLKLLLPGQTYDAILRLLLPGQAEALSPQVFLRSQSEVLAQLTHILEALTPAASPATAQGLEVIIVRRVEVATAGVPKQGPPILVSPAFSTSIRQRRHSSARTGYVAFSRASVNRTDARVEMENNDSMIARISNFDQVWFDATVNNTFFEMMAVR